MESDPLQPPNAFSPASTASSVTGAPQVPILHVKPPPPRKSWSQLLVAPFYWAWDTFDAWIWDERHEDRSGPSNYVWRSVQIGYLAIASYFNNRCSMIASALTYRTFLSFVPMLALAFVLFKSLGYQELVAQRVIENITAGSKEMVDEAVDSIKIAIDKTVASINNTKVKGLTGIGVIGLLVVAISMLQTIEQALNDIWKVRRGRNLAQMITEYLALSILAPGLLAVGTYLSVRLRAPETFMFSDWLNGSVITPLLVVAPHVAIWCVFIFIYYYMPNARVYWLSALIGGSIAGILWHLAQGFYIELTERFYARSYDVVYGALAWLFILIIWVYFSWTILLFGAGIAHAHQHLDDFRRRNRSWRGTPADMETLALRVASLLGRAWRSSIPPLRTTLSFEKLSDLLRIPPAPIQDTLGLMEKEGLVEFDKDAQAYSLARPPEDISTLDLLHLVRHGIPKRSRRVEESHPTRELDEVGRLLSRRLDNITVLELSEMPIERVLTLQLVPGKRSLESSEEPTTSS